MRKGVLFLLGLVSLAGVLSAQGKLKIGFINSQEVLFGTEEGKREVEALNQFGAQKQQEIAAQAEELKKLQDQFASQQRTLNPETRDEMQRTIQEKERALKRVREDAQLAYNNKRDALLKRMGDKIQKIVQEYAASNGYSVIFLRDNSQTYVDPSVDVTQEIIRIYNEQNPVAGGETKAKPGSEKP